MALPKLSSFFKRTAKPAAPAKAARPAPAVDPLADDNGPVQQARQRARRRLIGAVVLLAIGVVGFPLLFETQPRPLPADLPLEIAQRDGGVVRQVPAQAAPSPAPETAPPPAAATPAPATPAEAAPPAATPTPITAVEPPRTEPARTEPAQAAPPAPEIKPVPRPEPRPDTRAADAERARALLEGRDSREGRPTASPAANTGGEQAPGRFVVQVGAYTDAGTLREVRSKVEKIGLKTYTQVIDTDAGKRTRVRVGPFDTRQEADATSAKLKAAGLPGHVLGL